MNPLAIALQGIGLSVAFVALQGFYTDVVTPVEKPPIVDIERSYGGGYLQDDDVIDVDVASLNQEDEEEVVIAVLMQVVKLEYFS